MPTRRQQQPLLQCIPGGRGVCWHHMRGGLNIAEMFECLQAQYPWKSLTRANQIWKKTDICENTWLNKYWCCNMTESLKSCCKYHIRHQRIYLKETLQMLVLREMLQATSIRPQKSENQHHHINLFLKVNYHRNTFLFPFICRFSHQNTNNLKNS